MTFPILQFLTIKTINLYFRKDDYFMFNIKFGPRGVLQIDGGRIVHRNFEGRPSKYNKKGDRNFSLVIPNALLIDVCDEIPDDAIATETVADYLSSLGWNLKVKPPREEGEEEFIFLPIKVNLNGRVNIYLASGSRMTKLVEETVPVVDSIDIEEVDMDIRPYHWEVNGKTGTAAYLQTMKIVQRVDRFKEEYISNSEDEDIY